MIEIIIKASLTLTILAIILALFLYYASQKFELKQNPKVKEIIEVLPGANCGVCGLAGCDEYAKAVAQGKASFDGCKVGREEVALKIKKIMDK